MLSRFLACTLLACPFLLLAAGAHAGPTNPAISAIGDMRALWTESEEDDVELEFHELELSFTGPVNPYASAEIYVAAHEGEFEVEEAKLMLDRYLPGGFGLTIGRKLLDFGQLNVVHAHAWPFVDRPLMHSTFFSEDGIRDDGVRLDWLAPLEAATLRATAGAVRGDVFLGGHGHEEEDKHVERVLPARVGEEGEEADGPELGLSGRVDLFLEAGESGSFLIGASVLHGTHDVHEDAKATWFGIDGKASFDLGPSRALVLNAEAIFGSLDKTEEAASADPNGFFGSVDFRANRNWNVGGFVESATERFDDDVRTNRYGGFVGLA
ncbi:MAG: hypothetical protein HKN20_14805, partial [Gemmatimonadetes bacterium]|nr:hypothetical protein [Gemmatimonadota bacterium]